MKEEAPLSINDVSEADWEKTPESVKALVMSLLKRIEKLEENFAKLTTENELLKEQLKRNSQNSSKPPSQDKPRGFKSKPKGKSGRHRGGQPGHEGKEQKLYPPEACERIEDYSPQLCHHCSAKLFGEDASPYRLQVIELPKIEPVVIEHRFHQLECECCGALTRGWDEHIINGSRYGERLSALVGWLSGVGRQSHQQVQELLKDVFEIEISTGSINRLRTEVSTALSQSVDQAGEYIQHQTNVNIDETGFPQGNSDGQNPKKTKGWLWVVVTQSVSYFAVFLSRAQAVAKELLGEDFAGTVGSDRCGAYTWVDPEHRQVCWAHLKRDFTQISERAGLSAALGKALLAQQKLLFKAWYQVRDGTVTRDDFRAQVKPMRAEVKRLLREGADYDIAKEEKTPLAKTARTCAQMLKVEPAFWTFVDAEGVEPTNNSAERALRPAVLWRKQSFGSQSTAGSLFVSRMMTVVNSLKAQQRSVLDFLCETLRAVRNATPTPSLIPSPE